MEGLQTALGSDSPGLTLLVIVIGLAIALVLLFWIFRKIAGTGTMRSGRHKQPRLAVTSATQVDGKRRLVLIRRDDVEHLVMIGGNSDVLIESNIVSKRERIDGARNQKFEPSIETAEQPDYLPEKERAPSSAAAIAASTPSIDRRDQDFASTHVEATEELAGIDDEEDMHTLPDPGDSLTAGEPAEKDTGHDAGRIMRKSEYLNFSRNSFASDKNDNYPEPFSPETASSELEAELENALLPDEAPEDDFSSLEDELASLKPQPAPDVDAPDDDAKLEEASSKTASDKEPASEPPEKAKKPLSRNKDVEDEMQRLLDELANS